MVHPSYLEILPLENGREYASFYVYLPASEDGEYYARYKFWYEVNPVDPALTYENGVNAAANRKFYRIRTAYVVKRTENGFVPMFRALQDGEIGFAIKEEGAGDFVGGFHGDEILTEVALTVDGKQTPLDTPYFGEFSTLSFYERSYIFRCNTPDEKIMLHTQTYTTEGDRILLDQNIEWIADGRKIHSGYTPMLTAQRLNHENTDEFLSDTVEFYDKSGALIATFDTSDCTYGKPVTGGASHGIGTKATRAKAYKKGGGLVMEAGYIVRDGSIPDEQISSSLWIRGTDNKVYFEITGKTTPKKGTMWKSDIFYRVTYQPK